MNYLAKSNHSEITLAGGKTALVDCADLELVSQYRWHVSPSGKNFYAIFSRKKAKASPAISILMHRLILGVLDAGRGVVVDHINGNGLDNRRSNLRICTQQENLFNQGKRGRQDSKYKGVYRRGDGKKWVAMIPIERKLKNLGSFEREEDAARAYDMAALATREEFAFVNLDDSRSLCLGCWFPVDDCRCRARGSGAA